MALNDIDEMLDNLRRIKSGGDADNYMVYRILRFEAVLRLSRTFIKHHHILLPDSLVEIRKKIKHIVEQLHECKTILHLRTLVSLLLKFIEGNTTLRCSYELKASNLSDYMDCLGTNLNDVLMCLELYENDNLNQILKQLKIIQRKMGFLRYLYAMEINGNVDHEKVEGLETRIQFLADDVGQFCLAFWVKEDMYLKNEVKNYIISEPPYLLCLVMLVQLEMQKIFLSELKASKFCQSKTFKYQKMPKDFSHHLRSLLLHLKSTNLENISNNALATPNSSLPFAASLYNRIQKGLDEAIEFLLCFIDDKMLNEVLEKVGVIVGDVLFVIEKLLPNSIIKDDTCTINLQSQTLYLKNTNLDNFSNNVLDEEIEVLWFFLSDVPKCFIDDKMSNVEMVGAIVGNIVFVTQKLLPSSMIKDENLCSLIVEKTENLKAQVEKYYKSLKSVFPTVGGLSFLDFLLRKLNEVLESESSLIFMVKPHIGNLEKELSSLTSIFRDVPKLHHEHKFFKDRQRRIINLAYEVEVAIDSILAQCNSLWHILCSLPTILKEIKHISEEVTEMLKNRDVIPIVEPSTHLPTLYIDPLTDEEIVGFENDTAKIIKYLIGGTKDRDVIPIVGMGGQGKTTIARNVYNNSRIVSHFDVRAWCCISQTYNRIELLKEIHGQVSKSKLEVKDDELADMLRKELMGKRYLIVLDDMWDADAWEDLRPSFSDCGKGSRIIVTTRELEKVAAQIKQYTDPYSLPFLTPEESSELLQKKVFQMEGFPPKLQDVSLEVAERCKGLPLAVVLVAGIIKRKKTEESWWHEVKNSLLSHLGECVENSTLSTMQLSYDNLPDHIRPCLLYMGMLPEDASVPVSKLISLWIADGFVQSIESGRLEEAAESYLMDLISSNVVMISKRRYNGEVKYCKVHDVVHHFCMEMGRKEKFMLTVKGHCRQFTPCDWKVSRLSFNFTHELSENALLVSKARNPFHQQLRSLITTASEGSFSNQYRFPFPQVIKLRLLRVLDLTSHQVGYFSSATLNPLIHLKYLAVYSVEFHFHPESLLLNLETMILRCPGMFSFSFSVPTMFWKMEKLRHVDIGVSAKFDLKNNKQQMMEETCKLENLRILKKVKFHIDDVDVLFDRCPNLQELHMKVYGDSKQASLSLSLKKLESLTHLTLYGERILSELHLPLNLKKLALACPQVVTTTSLIAKLPSLEYLKLKDLRYSRNDWCLGDDIKFPKLKCLKLVDLGISRWEASEESFPLLERLVIKWCRRIKNIPPCFEDISTLKKIELTFLGNNKSLKASALKIKEEIEECQGYDRIDVIINGLLVRENEDLSEDSEEESEEFDFF